MIKKIIQNKFTLFLFFQTFIKLIATSIGLYSTAWVISETNPSQYADYTVIIGFVTIIQTIIIFGIPRIIQKTYTNTEDEKKRIEIWSTLAFLRFISYIIGIVLILVFINFTSIKELELTVLIFSSQFIILADEAFRAICDANEETWKYSLTDLLERLVMVVFLLLYSFTNIFSMNPLWFFGFVTLIGRMIMISADFIWQSKYISWAKPSLAILMKNKKALFYLTITSIFIGLVRGTQIVLDILDTSDIDLGTYYNANKLYMVGLIIPSMTLPMVSSKVRKNLLSKKIGFLGNLIKKYTNSITAQILIEWIVYSIFGGLVVFFMATLFSPIGIFLIDPQSEYPFIRTLNILIILLSSFIFYFPSFLISNIMTLSHYESYDFATTVIASLIGIIIIFILGYFFGVLGVAFGVLGVAFVDFLFKFLFLVLILRNGNILTKKSQ